MANNFCGKCGSKLDDNGRCPKCDEDNLNETNNYSSNKPKPNKSLLIVILALLVAIVSVGSYFLFIRKDDNKINYTSLFENIDNVYDYLKDNLTITNTVKASSSTFLLSEEGVIRYLSLRGVDSSIFYRYSLIGEDIGTKEVSYSSDTYPEYITYYKTSNEDTWAISVTNGEILAINTSSDSEPSKQTILTENDHITIYDNKEDTFKELETNESNTNIIKIDEINSEVMEEYSGNKSGVTIDEREDETNNDCEYLELTSITYQNPYAGSFTGNGYKKDYIYKYDENNILTNINTTQQSYWPGEPVSLEEWDYYVSFNDDDSYSANDSFGRSMQYDKNYKVISSGENNDYYTENYTYEYNDEGDVIKCISEDSTELFSYNYEYDSNHLLIKKTIERQNESYLWTYTFIYNYDGDELKSIDWTWEESSEYASSWTVAYDHCDVLPLEYETAFIDPIRIDTIPTGFVTDIYNGRSLLTVNNKKYLVVRSTRDGAEIFYEYNLCGQSISYDDYVK